MSTNIMLILCMLLGFLALHIVNSKNKIVGTGSAVVFVVILYYMIVPFIISCCGHNINSDTIKTIVNRSEEQEIRSYIAIFIFLFVFFITYLRYNRIKRTRLIFSEFKWNRICKILTWITFIVGGASLVVYINAFGGVSNLLLHAEYLRSFSTSGESVVSYTASIMVIPARLIIVTPILCLTLIHNFKGQNFIYKIILIISFLLSIIFLLANAGRTSIILMIIIYVLPILKNKFKHPWRLVVIAGCISLPILSLLDTLFVYLGTGEWIYESGNSLDYLPQFAYPIKNVLNMKEIVEYSNLRWGQDFITGVLNIIPGVNFEPSYVPTSSYYGGFNWKISGGTPNDAITFGYLQFGLFGVGLMAYLMGVICGKIDIYIKQLGNSYAYQVIATSLIVNFFGYVINADICSLVSNQVQLTIVAFCLLSSSKFKSHKPLLCNEKVM